MKNFLYMLLALLITSGAVYAQDLDTEVDLNAGSDSKTEQGTLTAAVMFGKGQFFNAPVVNSQTNFTNGSPVVAIADANENSSNNIVGVELRYFLSEMLALKVSGGGTTSSNPGIEQVAGVGDPSVGGVPPYNAVNRNSSSNFNFNLGAEYHLGTSNPNLTFWLGANGSLYHGKTTTFNPAFSLDNSGSVVFANFAERSATNLGWSAQQTLGFEYFVADGLYIGVETRPVAFTVAQSQARSAPDLEPLKINSEHWSFFSQTFIKLVFKLK